MPHSSSRQEQMRAFWGTLRRDSFPKIRGACLSSASPYIMREVE